MNKRLTDKQQDHEIAQLLRYLKARRLSAEDGMALMGVVAAQLIRQQWTAGHLTDEGTDEMLTALYQRMRGVVFKPGTLEA